MGCWPSKTSIRCVRCHSTLPRNCHLDDKCRLCKLSEQSRRVEVRLSIVRVSSRSVTPQPSSNNGKGIGVARIRSCSVTPQPSSNNGKGIGVARIRSCSVTPQPKPKTVDSDPQFGEFHCKPCRRTWTSRRCWPNKYQMCKRCKKPIYPLNCRELCSSDYTSSTDDTLEHEMKLCQMCQQLGYSCKSFGKVYNKRRI